MRNLWWIAILAAAAAPAQDRLPGQDVNFYRREKEVSLGRQLAREYRRHTTPLDNAAFTDYLNRLGARLAGQMPGGWTYSFEIVAADPGEALHEPAAFPGGIVFVSAGLLLDARNEAEFAGMLAHSMAHVAERHGTRLATKTELMQIASIVSAQAGNGIPNPPVGPQTGIAVAKTKLALEREADALAVKTLAAAGIDPAGLPSYLSRVEPPPQDRDERVAAMQNAIAELPAAAYQESGEFARVQASVKAR